MSCDCAQCRQHYKTLGVAYGIPSESEIQEAYQESVKQWHPDLYENYASLRADAEEHFKQIQVAYRELKEHNTASAELPAEGDAVQASGVVIQPKEETPAISFGDALGCLTAQHFTPQVEEMIAPHMGKLGLALAIVDLSGSRSNTGGFSHFFLLATRGIMMRDSRNIISVLWYTDLGEIKLIDGRRSGKPSAWQKLVEGISGSQPGTELQIYRSNGASFYSITGQVDDSVKTAIYNFLMRQKDQTPP
jgi:hypothetical protein